MIGLKKKKRKRLMLIIVANKTSLFFFGEKSNMQPMSSRLENDKFLFGMLYINLLNLV